MVEIGNSVTTIESMAFRFCSALTSIEIPNSVTSIGEMAFECTGLTSIEIPSSVTSIGSDAFSVNDNLKEVHVSSIESWCKVDLGTMVFFRSSCDLYVNGQKVTDLVVPGSVKKVKPNAFYGFKSFDKIVLEEGVEEIGEMAFENVWARITKELHLPSTLKTLVPLSFGNWATVDKLYAPNLAMLTMSTMEYLPYINSFDFYNGENNGPGQLYIAGEQIIDLVIPEDISEMKYLSKIDWIFRSINTGGLESLPIREYHFNNYYASTTSILEIGQNLKTIEANYPNVKLVISHAATPPTIVNVTPEKGQPGWFDPNSTTINVSSETFPLCTFDNEIPGVIVLDTPEMEDAYLNAPVWKDLMTSNMENKVEVTVGTPGKLATEIIMEGMAPAKAVGLKINGTINETDFEKMRVNMLALIDLDLTDLNLTKMPAGALQDKFQLESLKLPSVCTELGENSMNGCSGITSITLPSNLTTIGNGAFNGCSNLATVTNFSTCRVTSIGDDAYAGTKLTKADFNSGLKTIGNRAFQNVPLKSVNFPYGLTSIGTAAFVGCQLNQELELPEKLVAIGDSAFYGQNITGHLSLPETVSTIGSEAFAGTEISTLFLNSSLTELAEGVFENCKNLNTIYVPDNITTINARAFSGCEALANLRFAPTLTEIGAAAFQSSALRTAIIPDLISIINDETFDQCESLRTASLPSGVTAIGDNAFRGCGALRNLTVKAVTPPAINSSVFLGVNTNLCIISIPTVSFEDYALSNYWGRFVQMRNDIEVETDGNGTIGYDNGEEEESGEGNSEEPANAPAKVKAPAKAPATAEAENGSTVFVPKGGKIHFYITPGEGETILSATLDGQDIKPLIKDGVFTTTADKRGAKLVVKFSGVSAIDGINADKTLGSKTYNLNGIEVGGDYKGIVICDGKKILKR